MGTHPVFQDVELRDLVAHVTKVRDGAEPFFTFPYSVDH
jgi:hypothetical protein